MGAGQRARGVLRGARRRRIGLGRLGRTAAAGAGRGSAAASATGRAAAARVAAGGAPAWSPDGRTLLVAGLPDPQPVYNGNPLRNDDGTAAAVCHHAGLSVVACAGAAAGARAAAPASRRELAPTPALYAAAFTRAWQTLRGSVLLDRVRRRRRGGGCATSTSRAPSQAKSDAELEDGSLTRWLPQQPLIKPVDHVERRGGRLRTSTGVGGRPLAPREGRQHRRCDDRRVVCAWRRRAGGVGHRRRWRGGAVSQGDEAADGHRLQGSDADSCDAATTPRS